MTVDTRSRPVTATITILDSNGGTISGPYDLSNAIAANGLSISVPQFESRSPNGWLPFRAQLSLLADANGLGLNLDPRDTAFTPSGASLLAQGNRVDIQITRSDFATFDTVCPPLYILKIRQPLNLPRRTIELSLGDISLLEGRTPEGDESGFKAGTLTTRQTLINRYLSAADVPTTTDALSLYSLSSPPQKTSQNNWASEAGKVAATAGYYGPWLDRTGATRLTQIDFEQAVPALSFTIGVDGDEVGREGWERVNADVRVPRGH